MTLVTPRATWLAFPILTLTLFAIAFLQGDIRKAALDLDFVSASLCAFLLYAASSAFWAELPSRSLKQVISAALIAISALAAMNLLRGAGRDRIMMLARGAGIGFLIGLFILLADAASGLALRTWFLNLIAKVGVLVRPEHTYQFSAGKLVAIEPVVLNHSTTALTTLFWPMLMVVLGIVMKPMHRRVAAIVIAVLTVTVVFLSVQATAKIAVIAGFGAYLLATVAWRFTCYSLSAAWILCCLAVLPVAQLAYDAGLKDASWLKTSGQNRIVIWNQTAKQTMQAPILGRGADMTHELGPRIEKTLPPDKFGQQLSIHAHNIFLQTWFELGFVGIVLLTAVGVAILWQIGRAPPALQPFALATFTTCFAFLSSSFGMWQVWYVSLFGIVAIVAALGWRALEEHAPAPSGTL